MIDDNGIRLSNKQFRKIVSSGGYTTDESWRPDAGEWRGSDRADYIAGYADGWHGYEFGSGHWEPNRAYGDGFRSGRTDRTNQDHT